MLPEKLMDDLSDEIIKALKAMAKAKTPEEKLTHSQVVKNLCQSLGIFLHAAAQLMEYADNNESGPF